MPSLFVRPFQAPPPAANQNWKALPEHIGAIDVEIGCGTGLHSVQYALEHPRRYLVALERTAERFGKLERRIVKYGHLSNLLPVRADAQWWIPSMIKEPKIERVFLHYPNPYPKASQGHLRWHRSPFFGLLISKMLPCGEFLITTNKRYYYEEALDYLVNCWHLSVESKQISPHFPPRTHFEKKYLERGEPCFEIFAKIPRL